MDIRLVLVLAVLALVLLEVVVLVVVLALVQAGLLVKGLAVVAKVLALGSLSTYTYSHIETFACSGPPVLPRTPADSSPLVVHNHNHPHHLAWGREEMVLADSTDMTLWAPHTHSGNGHILLGTYSSHKLACCSLHQGSPLV